MTNARTAEVLYTSVANDVLMIGDSAVSDVEAGDKALTSKTGQSA